MKNTRTNFRKIIDLAPHVITTASLATALGVTAYYSHKYTGKTLLELKPEQLIKMVEQGGAVLYRIHGKDVLLKVIPTN